MSAHARELARERRRLCLTRMGAFFLSFSFFQRNAAFTLKRNRGPPTFTVSGYFNGAVKTLRKPCFVFFFLAIFVVVVVIITLRGWHLLFVPRCSVQPVRIRCAPRAWFVHDLTHVNRAWDVRHASSLCKGIRRRRWFKLLHLAHISTMFPASLRAGVYTYTGRGARGVAVKRYPPRFQSASQLRRTQLKRSTL